MSGPASARAELLVSQMMLCSSRLIEALGAGDTVGAASQLFEMRFAEQLLIHELAETHPQVISRFAGQLNQPLRCNPHALPARPIPQSSLFQEMS